MPKGIIHIILLSISLLISYNSYAQDQFASNENPIISTNQDTQPLTYKVYPNPTSDYITIKIDRQNNYRYAISNIIGKRILQGEFDKSVDLDLRNLRKGIYVLSIFNNANEKLATKKLIKE